MNTMFQLHGRHIIGSACEWTHEYDVVLEVVPRQRRVCHAKHPTPSRGIARAHEAKRDICTCMTTCCIYAH
eukprot:36695-Eustigmatos_ZCMA.PRE.1